MEILGTNLKEFFNEMDNEKICFSKEDMFETEDEDLKYNFKWLVPNSQKNEMEPILISLSPGGQYKEEKPHEGEEFGYVLSGSIYLHIGDKKIRLEKVKASILNLEQIIIYQTLEKQKLK
ncbi:cupin domain protein [[Clostridium] sordellii ATCC 9714]|nr:cupin domain protein [[Clostridium] sordellii ATCC 9714] [Paeniclostridium sordellii ATCC 9714]